jgi:hypothetical protein
MIDKFSERPSQGRFSEQDQLRLSFLSSRADSGIGSIPPAVAVAWTREQNFASRSSKMSAVARKVSATAQKKRLSRYHKAHHFQKLFLKARSPERMTERNSTTEPRSWGWASERANAAAGF